MWHWLAVGLLGLAGSDVEITQLGGVKLTGALEQLSAEALVVKTAQGSQRVELKNVLGVERPRGVARPKPVGDKGPRTLVELIDGSTFVVDEFVVSRGLAKLTIGGDAPFEARTRTIRSVRFATTVGLDQAWQDITAQKIAGDTLIIRKPARGEAADQPAWVLDRQEGSVQEITADLVQFEIDGDRIPVKREKLEGLVFFQPLVRELPDALARVTDDSGGRWNIKSIKLANGRFELETVTGVPVSLPVESIIKLDFSSGNTMFLSDLEPDSAEWVPFVESRAAAARLARLYQPRRDEAFSGGKIMLAGQSYEKGLSIHSRTTMVFRVPRSFKRLLATVGIDDRVRETGHVQLTVSGDGKVLWNQPIAGKNPPVELDLDLTGVKRITVLVDYGEGLDIADHLNLANARITK